MPNAHDVQHQAIALEVFGGRSLSARLFRPSAGRYPAILDFSPYRTFDIFRAVTDMTLPAWAAAGYATLGVDIAGSGASGGSLDDEYLDTEIADVIAAIEWCVQQDWCDGSVGLTGLSWSAFAALRAAAKRPLALKAMVLGGVSEDGWRTDIHYLGGAPYVAQVDWAGVMLMFNALPPDCALAGDSWRKMWLARLVSSRPWIIDWLTHSAADTYWAAKAAPIDGEVPLFLYSGFADKYATSVLRIAAQWRGPIRTIIGPWEHTLPHVAGRRPTIDFVRESLRWWDCFLKGHNTGALDDAPLRLWVGAPDADGLTSEGSWRCLNWPQQFDSLSFGLNQTRLDREPDTAWHRLDDKPPTPQGLGPDLYEDVPAPIDLLAQQSRGALMATSMAFDRDVEIAPTASLSCVAKGTGLIAARLIDLSPAGKAVRMTIGALRIEAKHGQVEIPLQASAWRLKAGHRLVLLLSGQGWPTLWPLPADVEVRDIRLTLGEISNTQAKAQFPGAVVPQGPAMSRPHRLNPEALKINFAPEAGAIAHESVTSYHLNANHTDYGIAARFEVKMLPNGQALAVKSYRVCFDRPDWVVSLDIRLEVRSVADAFEISWVVLAQQGAELVYKTEQRAVVKRNFP